jgi:gamma-glutamyltranspeptidase/glutathione hydrolase
MERGDQHVGFGIMGGANQPLAHAQFVSNIVDYGMNLQAALEAPRFTKRNSTGCDVSIEVRVPAATLQQLSERGHQIAIRREYRPRPGYLARFQNQDQLRGVRPQGGRSGDTRAHSAIGGC